MAAGDRNSIQKLQAGLKLLGYDVGRVDGAAGKNTNDQITKFLKDNNITGTDARDTDRVLEKIRQKTLSDAGANERLTRMAQNPATLDSENLKVLQGGLALHNVRTGPGADRVIIDGRMGSQTTEAAAKFSAAAPMNSTQMKMIQGGLALLGYDTGDIDGKLGKNTKAAMEKFAADRNLKPGGDMLKAVQDAIKYNGDARELMHAIGNSANAPAGNVMMLQAGLSLLGKPTLIDGAKGSETKDNFAEWSTKSPRPLERLPENKTDVTKDRLAAPTPRADMNRAASTNPTILLARNFTAEELKQRQAETLSSLKEASAVAGVSPELMLRIRRQESANGTNLVSKTNCLGDWQFTKDTFDNCINKYGTKVIKELEKRGDFEHAQKIRDYIDSKGKSEDLRLDPTVSTWMAARLVKENANYLKNHVSGFDTADPKTWGTQYAAFNVGPYAASKMATDWNEKMKTDWFDKKDDKKEVKEAIEKNESYSRDNATGAETLKRYDAAINKNSPDEVTIEQQLKTAMGKASPVSFAKGNTDTAEKPFTSMNAFREATAHTVSDDSSAALTRIKEAKIELVRWAKPQQPVFSLQPNLTM